MKPSLSTSLIVAGVIALTILICLTERGTPSHEEHTLNQTPHPSLNQMGVTSANRTRDVPIEGIPTDGAQLPIAGPPTEKRIVWPKLGGSIVRGSNYAYKIIVVTNPVVHLIGTDRYESLAKDEYRQLEEQPATCMSEIMQIIQQEGVPPDRIHTIARLAYELVSEDVDTSMASEVRKQLQETVSDIDREYEHSPESREAFRTMAIAEADREISAMAESRAAKMQHLRAQIAQIMGRSNEVMFLKLGSVRPRVFASPLRFPKDQ